MSTQESTRPKRRRWVTIALTISLALNLLVVGAIGSRFFFGHGGYYGRHHGQRGAMLAAGKHLLWSLPRERRNELKAIARQYRGQFKELHGEHDQARIALADAIAAQPFDATSFDTAYSAMMQTETKAQERIRTLGRDFILKLTAEERVKFAEKLRKPRWGRRHR